MKSMAIIILSVLSCLACNDDTNAREPVCFDPAKVVDPLICPDVVQPVCGCDGKTYSNACEAQGSGIVRWTDGACQ